MRDDPIVAEVRRHRAEIMAQFNGDLDAVVAYLQERERASGRKIVQPPKRRPARPRKRPGTAAQG